MRSLFRSVVVGIALMLLAGAEARASQGSCIMPTTGTVSGLTLVNDINACNQALLSLNSGASAPSGPAAGELWFDTTTNYIRQYDGASWNNLWYVDASNHLIVPSIGGGTANLTGAGTVDIGSVPQAAVNILGGAGPITSFGSSAIQGTIHFVTFGGAYTLTHNISTFFLVGQRDITTAGGDVATALYSGGGVWHVFDYAPASTSPMADAYSIHGNSSGSVGPRTDISIPALTLKGTPASADKVMIADSAAGNALKYATLLSISQMAGGTVQSINLTAGTCISVSGGPVTVSGSITVNGTCFTVAATKADQQAGTSNTVPVTPLHQQDHKSAMKVNCAFEGRPTATLLGGYGCSGISRTSAGLYTVSFSTAFANTTYNCTATTIGAATAYFGAKSTGSITINTVNLGSSPVGSDNTFDIQCGGDQ